MTRSNRRRGLLLACIVALALGGLPAQASASETRYQVGSALASVVYAPAKVAYAALGVVFGGIAWGLAGGDDAVMRAVIDPAIGGDYLVTPAHLRGERSLAFVGGGPEAAPVAAEPYPPDDAILDDPARYGGFETAPYSDPYDGDY